MTIRKKIAFVLALVVLAPSISQAGPKKGLEKIDHIVVIYLENRSFDNLFGLFPGANGLAKAKKAPLQIDEYGRAYIALPPVFDGKQRDNRFTW